MRDDTCRQTGRWTRPPDYAFTLFISRKELIKACACWRFKDQEMSHAKRRNQNNVNMEHGLALLNSQMFFFAVPSAFKQS